MAQIMNQRIKMPTYFSQAPHQRSIHAHKFLAVDLIGFVQNASNLVVISFQALDGVAKFIGYVQLVRVED